MANTFNQQKEELKEWITQNIPGRTLILFDKINALTPDRECVLARGPFGWPYDENRYRVITRDGREVTQLTRFDVVNDQHFYGVVDDTVYAWYGKGNYFDGIEHPIDLFLVEKEPEMVEMWVNYYPDGCMTHYSSQYDADRYQSLKHRIGPAIKITFPKPLPPIT